MHPHYKHSLFNVSQKIAGDTYIIFNTLTQGLLEVDAKTYSQYEQVDFDSEPVCAKFLEYGFWIEEDCDEIAGLKVRHRRAKFAQDRVDLTINTTNNCNFTCVYCYQDQVSRYMSDDVTDRISRFFVDKINHNLNSILIHWFGGEPLLHPEPIFKLERYLQTHFIGYFTSQLTTNGYLLHEENIRRLSKTNIALLQITLDGVEAQHDQTRVLAGGQGTFSTIVANVKRCLALWPKVKIVLRININRLNEDIDEFLEFLLRHGLQHDRIRLHISEAKNYKDSMTDTNRLFYGSIEEYAGKLLEIYKSLAKYGFPIPMYSFRGYNCDFDCINNFLIDTDGKLYQCKCEGPESPLYLGELAEDGIAQFRQRNLARKMLREPFEKDACLRCKVLPMCMGGCNYLEQLGREACIPEKYILDEVVALYYQTHL